MKYHLNETEICGSKLPKKFERIVAQLRGVLGQNVRVKQHILG